MLVFPPECQVGGNRNASAIGIHTRGPMTETIREGLKSGRLKASRPLFVLWPLPEAFDCGQEAFASGVANRPRSIRRTRQDVLLPGRHVLPASQTTFRLKVNRVWRKSAPLGMPLPRRAQICAPFGTLRKWRPWARAAINRLGSRFRTKGRRHGHGCARPIKVGPSRFEDIVLDHIRRRYRGHPWRPPDVPLSLHLTKRHAMPRSRHRRVFHDRLCDSSRTWRPPPHSLPGLCG